MARPLSKMERACLTCPLADCQPESSDCPQRVMQRAEKAARMRKARATRNTKRGMNNGAKEDRND